MSKFRIFREQTYKHSHNNRHEQEHSGKHTITHRKKTHNNEHLHKHITIDSQSLTHNSKLDACAFFPLSNFNHPDFWISNSIPFLVYALILSTEETVPFPITFPIPFPDCPCFPIPSVWTGLMLRDEQVTFPTYLRRWYSSILAALPCFCVCV